MVGVRPAVKLGLFVLLSFALTQAQTTVNPISVNFGSMTLGNATAPVSVVLTNTGKTKVTSIVGATSGDYSQTNNCPASLSSKASCTFSVTFRPSALGTDNGTLTITYSGSSGSPQTIPLSGTGTIPTTVNPSSINFGSVLLGSTSSAMPVTLKNNQGISLTSVAVSASGDFAQTNNCASNLAAGASCTINVTFAPTVGGTRSGQLTIRHSAVNSPDTVSLSGTGLVATLGISPASLSFAGQPQGTVSSVQNVSVTNTGSVSVTMSSISASGEFQQSNNCPASLAIGASCNVAVSFAPQSVGSKSGTLTITDSATGSPHTVSLSGTGTSLLINVSPATLSFGDQLQHTTSASQSVTVSNVGTAAVSIAGINVSGEFSQVNTCPTSLLPGNNCQVTIAFVPQSAGSKAGTLTINDNASGGPHSVALGGNGTSMTVSVSPASLTFGSQLQNTTSTAQTVTLTNTGTIAISITSLATSPEFTQTNNCPASLASGASCSASVSFAPISTGAKSGTLTIADNATGGPHSVALSGTGTSKSLTVSPTSVNFGSQPMNTTSAGQGVTITNTGTLDLSISRLQTNGTFAQTNNCPATLVSGASCTANVTFTPAVMGVQSGSLVVYDNAINGPHTVTLSGTGTTVAMSISPNALSFGNQMVNTASSGHALTLTNTGNLAVTISGIGSTGAFAQTNNCPASLAVGTWCTVTVTFSPTTTGYQTGSVTINDNATGGPHTLALSGTGTSMNLGLSPAIVNFGDQLINTTSASQNVTIRNTGTLSVSISGVTITSGFAQSNNCPASLASGSSCTATISFTPTNIGTQTGTLTIYDNAAGAPHTVSLSGNGGSLSLSISPASLAFGDQRVNTTSASQTITITNTGTLAVSNYGMTVGPPFNETNDCPSVLPAGSACTITVSFAPSAMGSQSGVVTVFDNVAGSPQTVALSGNGTSLSAIVSSSSVAFGDETLGHISPVQTVTLTNTGNVNVTITGVFASGDFEQSNNCPAVLAGGLSCALQVTFVPRTAGALTGSVVISDNSGPHTITLSGNGVTPTTQVITITPGGSRLLIGNSQSFTATQLLSDGTTVDVTSQATWTSSDASLVSLSGNTATAVAAGTITLTAQAGSLSGNVTVIAKGAGSVDTSPMHFARYAHAAVSLPDGRVLVVGGQDENSNYVAQAELFDPDKMSFDLTGTMNRPRAWFAAVPLQDGRVLVVGGTSAAGTEASLEIYDPATGQFSLAGSLYSPANYPCAVVLNDGRVLITSGADAELYDPQSETVTVVGPMNANRAQHTLTLLQDGRVLVAGGDQSPAASSTAEIFDPQTLTFTFTGGLPVLRSDHTATLLQDGRVLIAGGFGSGLLETQAYLYDPGRGAFIETGSLTTSRYDHRAVLLPDGRVMIGGGLAWFFDTASVEIYDPATGLFSLSKELNARRGTGTASLLPSGEVLFSGGYNYDPGVSYAMAPQNTAELYSGSTTLNSVSIVPANPTVTGYQNIEFQFLGTFADGSTQTLTDIGNWTSDNSYLLYMNQDSGMSNGNATSGTVTVTGQLGSMTASTTVTTQ